MLGRPCHFDFSGPPPPPDWVIDGIIERGTITLLSADSGVGKSLISDSMAVAIIQGKPWVGRKTSGQRCMFIDEENFYRVVAGRFKALGMTNEDRSNLCYFLRLGVSLGADDYHERLMDEIEAFHPDFVVIDTASAATAVDVNDNSSVARLFATVLRPLADQSAVVLLHHERKPQAGQKRNAGHAMMGARQWAGQADAHVACEAVSSKPHVEELPDGAIRKTYHMAMETPKNRDGAGVSMKLSIVSEHEAGSTQAKWLRVEKTR